jgi:hypothetical protein
MLIWIGAGLCFLAYGLQFSTSDNPPKGNVCITLAYDLMLTPPSAIIVRLIGAAAAAAADRPLLIQSNIELFAQSETIFDELAFIFSFSLVGEGDGNLFTG